MEHFSFREDLNSVRNIVINDPNEILGGIVPRLIRGEIDSITINYQLKAEFDVQNPEVCIRSNSPFCNIKELKHITAKIILGPNVISTAGLFFGCAALENVPLIDTQNIIDMNRMFMGCSSLKCIPQYNTTNCNNMSAMFCGCSSLNTIPKLDTKNVWNFSYMFMNAVSLTKIPVLDLSSAMSANSMFCGCVSLTTVPMLDTSHITDMTRMFASCRSLAETPMLDFSAAHSLSEIFFNCPCCKSNPVVNSYDELTQDIIMGIEQGTIKTLTINYDINKKTSPFRRVERKFRKTLTDIRFKINIGKNVKSLSYLFYGLKSLKTAPIINTSGVSDFSHMFEGCADLQHVPIYNTEHATDLRRMFCGCSSLSVKPKLKISETMETKDMYISSTWAFIKDTLYRFRNLPLDILKIIAHIIWFIVVMILKLAIGIINTLGYILDLFGSDYHFRYNKRYSWIRFPWED